ncbi:RWD domain-containing protein 2A [Malaya genurostris]|uniref:RWD domain-containing protein 2A n=1 Tax=Malaya genurostris TaxID=325434 RepID=UPI0026F37FCD|nr:RWD domain-containing protein 2A [Malaya genurostris]XP_058458988.1 RWD domain-containing protein 2A [Malaya genurostris]
MSIVQVQNDLLRDCLRKQLDEFHMLSSIFCNPGELHVDNYSFVDNINAFVEGETAQLRAKLDYQLNLPLLEAVKVQIRIELPHLYPGIEVPDFVIRSTMFSRDQERLFSRKIEQYIDEEVLDKNESYVYQVISWIQDNFLEMTKTIENSNTLGSSHEIPDTPSTIVFERLWIYSHHLKSKTKRQTILKTAKEYNLSGFSRPGKPAIICVEGQQKDTQVFWRTIRPLKWQKIQIRLTETEMIRFDQLNCKRRFPGFREELITEVDEDNDEEVPMNMSLFMKFLDKHESGYIRKEIFGFYQTEQIL